MDDLKLLARGFADMIPDADDYVLISRFSARQLAAFKTTPAYTACSTHTAGVRLTFRTDGDELRFKCKLPPRLNVIKALVSSTPTLLAQLLNGSGSAYQQNRGIKRTWISYSIQSAIKLNVFELVLDGVSVSLTRAVNGEIVIPFDNPDHKMCRVDLYFPILEGALIKDFTVNGAVEPAIEQKQRLLCLGDSITHGCLAFHPSRTYVNLVAESLGVEVINQGVAGCTHMPLHLDGLEDIPEPDLITIAYGTNDWNSLPTFEEIRQNIAMYYARVNAVFPGKPIKVITPIWRADMDESRPCGEFTGVRAIITEEASVWPNMTVIDGLDMTPHDSAYYEDSYLHPNEQGFAFMAEKLLPLLNVL